MRYVLGLETSCDETSAAVVADGTNVLSSVVASQSELHARWGGVVPEVASRLHVERVLPVVVEALADAGIQATDVGGIAVTNRPGLVGSLVVGVAAAKSLSLAWRVPLVGVHHVVAHVHAARLVEPTVQYPLVCLVVSGGHTELVLMEPSGIVRSLGRTRDDAAGECLDKCARLMDLPYPGGPEIEKIGAGGRPDAVPFPRAWLGDSLDFSFSGLKTAVGRFLKQDQGRTRLADVAASLEFAIIDVLITKCLLACQKVGARTAALGGGVAANRRLASELARRGSAADIRCVAPPPEFCTDNAAMVAAAGYGRLVSGDWDDLHLDVAAAETLAG